ncbi:hypothetical protein [Candidatus Regiella insecticola]|nr:hypothetical protein [Candidatus Regiella insecticola]
MRARDHSQQHGGFKGEGYKIKSMLEVISYGTDSDDGLWRGKIA